MKRKGSWGGARPGAGALKKRIHLDTETARRLRTLTRYRRGLNPAATEEQVVMTLIEHEWQRLDQAFQQAADDET